MPDRLEDLIRSLPDGACTVCLARRDGQTVDDLEAIVDAYLVYLPIRVTHGICPLCGAVGRVVRMVEKPRTAGGGVAGP
jgi:hypothetical protein